MRFKFVRVVIAIRKKRDLRLAGFFHRAERWHVQNEANIEESLQKAQLGKVKGEMDPEKGVIFQIHLSLDLEKKGH